jgi:hypothetical protein
MKRAELSQRANRRHPGDATLRGLWHLRIDLSAMRHFTAAMRRFLGLVLSGLLFAGCATHHAKTDQPDAVAPGTKEAKAKVIMTPDALLTGKVVSLNAGARFVVANFPVSGVPAAGQTLDAYRQGLKVGEVKISNFQQGDNTVADIVTGEAQVGDELRSR